MSTPYENFARLARAVGREVAASSRPVVCIQGLGFVGTAMAVASAMARDPAGDPWFDVVGVDVPRGDGQAKVDAINSGRLPLSSVDRKLEAALTDAHRRGNLVATTDPAAYALASVVVVNLPLDVTIRDGEPSADFEPFRRGIRTLGQHLPIGALVIVETTVPPGTCEKVVRPELDAALAARGLPPDSVLLAHSYERVMPGADYLDSIVNFWRVYAGATPAAAVACEAFLSKIINIKKYPLTRLATTTASETGKVLENSYRSVTIAFMEEWGRFAEEIGVDLFAVIDAIRVRPTHSNIRQPGFGVGGYCLTKDPLFAYVAARELFSLRGLDFPFCKMAVDLNARMPLVSLRKLEARLRGLSGRTVLLLGVSYRQDVGDTRHSPSEVFARAARDKGARIVAHDPLLREWPQMDLVLPADLPSPNDIDAVVLAVPHREYADIDFETWLGDARPLIFDSSNVLTPSQRKVLTRLGCPLMSIGRGDG